MLTGLKSGNIARHGQAISLPSPPQQSAPMVQYTLKTCLGICVQSMPMVLSSGFIRRPRRLQEDLRLRDRDHLLQSVRTEQYTTQSITLIRNLLPQYPKGISLRSILMGLSSGCILLHDTNSLSTHHRP